LFNTNRERASRVDPSAWRRARRERGSGAHSGPPLLGRKRRDDDDQLASWVYRDRTYREHTESAGWDALRYALQVLRVLGIADTSIALFYGTRGVSVDSGRDWGRGPGQRWATVSVAPWATREEVAAALMALAGRADEPLLLQSLLALEKAS
jgi:hypothetical protein